MRKNNRLYLHLMVLVASSSMITGCGQMQQPTLAHVHVGHALTGAHDTPTKKGYFVVAEGRAKEALKYAEQANNETTLVGIQTNIKQAIESSTSDDNFGVKHALTEAAHHVTFAALSADASNNIKQSAEVFNEHINPVLDRCDLIKALGQDILATTDKEEGKVLANEILTLTRANDLGEDANNDGVLGSTPAGYGLVQLREELEDIINREDPPYQTVDQWYLFNLSRLPNGDWVFRKSFGNKPGGY